MKAFIPLLMGGVVLSAAILPAIAPAAPPDDADLWSKPIRGLQARVTLVEKAKNKGTRSLVPYLELRNAGDSASPLQVRCGRGHVQFELVGADGKVVRDGWLLPRGGPHADPGTIILPFDSSMRLGMYCSSWGVSDDVPATIATDSGAWELQAKENGKVYLRATVQGKKGESDADRTWYGTIRTPLLKVNWKK